MPERWLVIAHEATNSGAPRMLLDILRGVRATRGADWSCEIILRRGGPLVEDFARLGPVRILTSYRWMDGPALGSRLCRLLVDRPWVQPARLKNWFEQWRGTRFDLVYNNTATNGFIVSAVRNLSCPVLTHVHELGYSLRRFNTTKSLGQTLVNSDHFLAVSPAVATDLARCGVSAGRITVVPNFLKALPVECEGDARCAKRIKLGLPPDVLIVTGCGHIDGLKGTDLFVEMAAALVGMTSREILFNWIGGESDSYFAGRVRRLVRRRGIEKSIRFVGEVPNADAWFGASDVVAVTSRVESFSLVALEAAAAGRPVVGFSGARGLEDLLGKEPGLLVDNFDPVAMASVVHGLLHDSLRAVAVGQRLRLKVEGEFLAGPSIASILGIVDKLKSDRISDHGG